MGKLLGIDFGIKRMGIAITDDLQIISSALETVASQKIMTVLQKLIETENIEGIVLGQPKRMNNQMSDIEQNILLFIEALNEKFPQIKIYRQDERFTSKMAFQTMIDAGLSKKKRAQKETIDKVSAAIILQDFLGSRQNN